MYKITLRIGRSFKKVKTASLSFNRRYCPFGLLISEHTLANREFGAIPTIFVGLHEKKKNDKENIFSPNIITVEISNDSNKQYIPTCKHKISSIQSNLSLSCSFLINSLSLNSCLHIIHLMLKIHSRLHILLFFLTSC